MPFAVKVELSQKCTLPHVHIAVADIVDAQARLVPELHVAQCKKSYQQQSNVQLHKHQQQPYLVQCVLCWSQKQARMKHLQLVVIGQRVLDWIAVQS